MGELQGCSAYLWTISTICASEKHKSWLPVKGRSPESDPNLQISYILPLELLWESVVADIFSLLDSLSEIGPVTRSDIR